jgi:hypothetical protein
MPAIVQIASVNLPGGVDRVAESHNQSELQNSQSRTASPDQHLLQTQLKAIKRKVA